MPDNLPPLLELIRSTRRYTSVVGPHLDEQTSVQNRQPAIDGERAAVSAFLIKSFGASQGDTRTPQEQAACVFGVAGKESEKFGIEFAGVVDRMMEARWAWNKQVKFPGVERLGEFYAGYLEKNLLPKERQKFLASMPESVQKLYTGWAQKTLAHGQSIPSFVAPTLSRKPVFEKPVPLTQLTPTKKTMPTPQPRVLPPMSID